MKKAIYLIIGAILVVFFTGCSIVVSPVGNGVLFTAVKAPFTATSNEVSTKTGSSTCYSILGLAAFGDASIKAACRNAGITKIHHVDYDAFSVLSLFSTYTVEVYGE